MRLTMPATVAVCVLLAACGKGGDKNGDNVAMSNASVADVAKVQAAKLQPGQWEMRIEQVSSETSGGSGNMPQMPKVPPSTAKVCLTAEQTNDPTSLFGSASPMQKNCVYDSFSMKDGKIDAKMHCTMGDIKVAGTSTGTFSATEMASESHSEITGLPGGMSMKTHMKMDGKRLGECQPGDIKAGDTKAPAAG